MVSYSEVAKTKAIRKALKEFEKNKMVAPQVKYVKPKKPKNTK